ncbi:MAG: hypothetical protein ACR2JQ_11240 [Mycobacteriales bacterium]
MAVVFDHTALLALGAGSRMLSGLVSQAHLRPGRYIFAPALCLAAAVAERPGLGDHIGVLPAMQVIDLDYPAAAAVGRFIAAGVDWRTGQAINAGRPTADWPDGRPVLTTTPEAYADWGVEPIVAT